MTKVSDCSFDFENKVLGVIPRLVINEKKEYDESGTKEFDRMAFKYLGMACFPLGICYCIYRWLKSCLAVHLYVFISHQLLQCDLQ